MLHLASAALFQTVPIPALPDSAAAHPLPKIPLPDCCEPVCGLSWTAQGRREHPQKGWSGSESHRHSCRRKLQGPCSAAELGHASTGHSQGCSVPLLEGGQKAAQTQFGD